MVEGLKIASARKEKKISQQELASMLKVSQQTIAAWEKNGRNISAEQIERLSMALEKPAAFFLDSFGGKNSSNESGKNTNKSGLARIPIYEAEASAGHGCLNDTEVVESYLMIDRETIRGELQCNPDNLAIIRVRGDSMTPTIKPGEAVVIDKTVKTIVSDGLYVMRMTGDVTVVKRIQTLPKSINIISDNKAYPPYQIGFDDTDGLAVIGRVVAIISMEKVGA